MAKVLEFLSLIAQLVKNLCAMQETWFNSWVAKICWKMDRLPIPVFLGGLRPLVELCVEPAGLCAHFLSQNLSCASANGLSYLQSLLALGLFS